MRGHGKAGVVFLLCVLLLAGCGQAKLPKNIETDTIVFDKEGAMEVYLVRDFDREYYDLSELTAMAAEEAAQYNTENAGDAQVPVVVEKVETLEGTPLRARITYHYDSADSFCSFNDNEISMFFGTVSAAVQSGETAHFGSLSSVKDNSLVTEDWIKQEASARHLIITQAKALIYCPYPVTHVTQGAMIMEDGSVDTTAVEGVCAILMKK